MKKDIEFDEIPWHDGVIKDCHIVMHDNTISVKAKFKVYLNDLDDQRVDLEVLFKDILDYQFTFDAKEIIDNSGAGNISDVFSRDEKNYQIYTFIFFGGYLKVISNKIKMTI